MWQVEYTDLAEADILALDKPIRKRVLTFFRERVAAHPDPRKIAEPLSGVLRGLRRFRVGDYHANCDIQGDRLVVLIVEVGHRGEIYRHAT